VIEQRTYEMVIPRFFSSGALSISSYAVNLVLRMPFSASAVSPHHNRKTNRPQLDHQPTEHSNDRAHDVLLVMAAVSVVLPWSTWPIVPTFKCGLSRTNSAKNRCCNESDTGAIDATKQRTVGCTYVCVCVVSGASERESERGFARRTCMRVCTSAIDRSMLKREPMSGEARSLALSTPPFYLDAA